MNRTPYGRHSTTLLQTTPAEGGRRSSRRGRRAAVRARFAVITGAALLVAASVITGVVLVAGGGRTPALRPAAVSSSVPLLGSSVNASDLSTTTAQFGHLPIVRVYYPGLPASNAWNGGSAGANHSATIVSFKALPKDILSGADDAILTHFFDTAPTGHPIYFSYYHEPEDNIADGQFTLGDYKAAWARVVTLADAAHNPDLHSTLILMAFDLAKASGRDWKSYLPGGGIISTLGWDAYPAGSATNVNPQPTPPADFLGPCITAAKSVGLPYAFPEFGLSTPVGRPAWLTAVGKYLMTSGALFASYFNGNPQYPTLQLTDQPSQAVWKSFVAQSVAASTGSGPATASPSTPATSPSTPATPSPSVPTTASPSSVPTSSAPATASSWVTGLSASPARFIGTGHNHTVITFRISQAADVTVQVLQADGTVARQIVKPAHAAGQLVVPYYGFNGHGVRLPAGPYKVLVVASNASGRATAETALTISPPQG
jgi:hypothetical protein